ncbi:MAG: insulinase family protein, partial [Nitrospira sp.]|nr:insulinase family protein [Nitrospira sp.]
MPSLRSVAVGVWEKVGTRDEGPDQKGLAHFLEHHMFK